MGMTMIIFVSVHSIFSLETLKSTFYFSVFISLFQLCNNVIGKNIKQIFKK